MKFSSNISFLFCRGVFIYCNFTSVLVEVLQKKETLNLNYMRYSKYFGSIIREKGLPHLSILSFQQMMNMVLLEGKIEGLKRARKLVNKEEPYKFDMEIFSKTKQLTTLTGNLPPDELLRNLIQNSRE